MCSKVSEEASLGRSSQGLGTCTLGGFIWTVYHKLSQALSSVIETGKPLTSSLGNTSDNAAVFAFTQKKKERLQEIMVEHKWY